MSDHDHEIIYHLCCRRRHQQQQQQQQEEDADPSKKRKNVYSIDSVTNRCPKLEPNNVSRVPLPPKPKLRKLMETSSSEIPAFFLRSKSIPSDQFRPRNHANELAQQLLFQSLQGDCEVNHLKLGKIWNFPKG